MKYYPPLNSLRFEERRKARRAPCSAPTERLFEPIRREDNAQRSSPTEELISVGQHGASTSQSCHEGYDGRSGRSLSGSSDWKRVPITRQLWLLWQIQPVWDSAIDQVCPNESTNADDNCFSRKTRKQRYSCLRRGRLLRLGQIIVDVYRPGGSEKM